jgi:site-specific recombinase XerD
MLRYQESTAVSYAQDILFFYGFLKSKNPLCKKLKIKEIPFEIIENLGPRDINEFQNYVASGHKPDKKGNIKPSNERAIARKMAAVRNYFKYLVKYDYLKVDPTLKAAVKKKDVEKKDIRRLNSEQVQMLMNSVSEVNSASYHSKVMSEVTSKRDLAIVTLLLNTGIRVSECAGLDLSDVNFDENTVTIVRKGGYEDHLYINEIIRNTLRDYIKNERPSLLGDAEEKALFISLKHNRLSIRSIQHMIEKYGKNTGLSQKLTPHKLRRTYGTALYNKTSDIYMVADVLGHKDVNTTVKHYAAIEEEHKKQASQVDVYGTGDA